MIDEIRAALQLAMPTIPISFERQALAANTIPARIVLEPVDEDFGNAHQNGVPNPRSLATRHLSLDVHIWGLTYSAVEVLIAAFVTAMRTQLGVNYDLRSATWKGQSFCTLGKSYTMRIAINVPVPETVLDTVILTTIITTDVDIAYDPHGTLELETELGTEL